MLSTARRPKAPQDEHLDLVFRALGDRTRRALLDRLARGPATVGELARPFEMSWPAVGKHLRVLERAGLLTRDIEGRCHRCSLKASPLREAEEWLDRYQRFWDETLDSLVQHFGDEPDAR